MSLLIQLSFAHHHRFLNSGFQTTQLHHRLTEVNTFPSKFPQFLPRPNIAYTSALLLLFSKPVHVSFSRWSLAPWAGCNQSIFSGQVFLIHGTHLYVMIAP